MSLGERIYKLRSEKNLSQGELADALDVSRQSISKWETNSSVPELDKLIKLSQIFGVTLDELILDKPPQEAPQAPPPQTVCAEKAAPGFGQKVTGTILICFGALVWLLITVLGDILAGSVFALPFVLCGLICLLVRRHAGLWCLWVVYFSVDAYLQYATGITWKFALIGLTYTLGWTVQLIISWCLLLSFAALTVATAVLLRTVPMALSRKSGILVILCWVLFGVSRIPVPYPPVAEAGVIWWARVLLYAVDWVQNVLLVVALTNTTRLIAAWQKKRKEAG